MRILRLPFRSAVLSKRFPLHTVDLRGYLRVDHGSLNRHANGWIAETTKWDRLTAAIARIMRHEGEKC